MEYRRGRITQEYRRWGRRARLARFRARSQAARGVPLVASRRQLPRPILQRSSPARTGQRDSDRSDRDSGSDDSRLRPVYLLRHRAVPLPRSFLKEADSMPAWLATCSVVCRLTLPLRRRAAYVVAALLFTAAVPGWALSPVALVDLGSDTTFACGRIPAGGYLLVWQNLSQGLSVQRFTEAGGGLWAGQKPRHRAAQRTGVHHLGGRRRFGRLGSLLDGVDRARRGERRRGALRRSGQA